MNNRVLRNLRTVSAPVGLLLLLSGTASADKVKVTGSWAEGASRGQPFTRVLVVGISPDEKVRCRFERFMAARINNDATKAVASCDAVTKVDPLTLASIQDAVAWLKVDGVVATSLVTREWDTKEGGGGRDTRGTANYKATDSGYMTGYYGMYGVPVIYGEFQATPAITTLKGTVHITSKVYATAGPTMVYTLDTTATGFESTDRSLSSITVPIADRLRRDGLTH